MAKSLSTGASKIVPVKMADEEKQAAIAACDDGQSLSDFIRSAVKSEVKRKAYRVKKKQR